MYGIADEIARANLRLVKIKDQYIAAACPFHKGGQERNASFWIDRESGHWGCWSCSASGSNLKMLLSQLGVRNLKAEALIDEALSEAKKEDGIRKIAKRRRARAEFRGEHVLPDSLLGVYDWCPKKLLDEGFTEWTLRTHDVGFDKARDRITFPIRDIFGNLIGISGRATEPGTFPKYKVYQGWHEVDGKRFPGELGEWFPEYSSTDIRNHLWRAHLFYHLLYNGLGTELLMVEGYKAAMWLVQMEYLYTGAIMGSRMSQGQERLIKKMGVPTWVMLDNNKAGRDGTRDIEDRLGRCSFPVYLCEYHDEFEEDTQPSDLSAVEIETIKRKARRARGRFYGYRNKLPATGKASKY